MKSSSHTHLYINLPKEPNRPFKYFCQKCNASGIINENFIKDLKIYDYEAISKLKKHNNESINENKKRKIKDDRYGIFKYDLKIPKFKESKSYKRKLNYINNRFSFNLKGQEYIDKYKCVFSLADFLLENDLDVNSVLSNNIFLLEDIVKNYVGFMSTDNSAIVFRNTDKNCEKKNRFFIYNIFDSDELQRFCSLDKTINKFIPKVKIVLAEGIFDIIGVKEYFYNDIDTSEYIFSSISGKGFNLVINHFARMGFINADYYIYSDSDVSIEFYKKMKRNNSVLLNNDMYIIYNNKSKDYGCKLNEINLRKPYKI